MKKYSSLVLILVLNFLLIIIVNAQATENSKIGKLLGELRNCYGDEISDAKITIQSDRFKRKLKSDKNGKFIISLSEGKYKILIQKYGFRSYLYPEIEVQKSSETKIVVDMKFGYATGDPNHDKPLSKPCPMQDN